VLIPRISFTHGNLSCPKGRHRIAWGVSPRCVQVNQLEEPCRGDVDPLMVSLHRPYRAPLLTIFSILGLTPQAISHHPFGVLDPLPPRQSTLSHFLSAPLCSLSVSRQGRQFSGQGSVFPQKPQHLRQVQLRIGTISGTVTGSLEHDYLFLLGGDPLENGLGGG